MLYLPAKNAHSFPSELINTFFVFTVPSIFTVTVFCVLLITIASNIQLRSHIDFAVYVLLISNFILLFLCCVVSLYGQYNPYHRGCQHGTTIIFQIGQIKPFSTASGSLSPAPKHLYSRRMPRSSDSSVPQSQKHPRHKPRTISETGWTVRHSPHRRTPPVFAASRISSAGIASGRTRCSSERGGRADPCGIVLNCDSPGRRSRRPYLLWKHHCILSVLFVMASGISHTSG